MNSIEPFLQAGFDQYILTNQIIFIADYKTTAMKRLVKIAKEKNELYVIDLSRGRKALSLIGLRGNIFVISAIPRKQLVNRMLSMNSTNE